MSDDKKNLVELPPFQENAICPKCGWTIVGAHWCRQTMCHVIASREHMHRRCIRCDYGWIEACLT